MTALPFLLMTAACSPYVAARALGIGSGADAPMTKCASMPTADFFIGKRPLGSGPVFPRRADFSGRTVRFRLHPSQELA